MITSVSGMYAQEADKPRPWGIHGGLNTAVLNPGSGLSLSVHYSFNTQRVLQPEVAIAYDAQKGETFSNGDDYKSSALSFYGGLRLNLRPKKNWNPSFYIMPGLMFESSQTSRYDDPGQEGTSLGAQLGLSNTFNKKHMISIGFFGGNYIDGLHLKYGFIF
ncbi:MAG: hypothetical protein MUF39_03455 [Cyclobacteriaceae bacterium]|nr:hypothetical protein [Cyclobacteriaceae bacterium]